MANRSGNKESQRNLHANECLVCKKHCDNICSRCGEFYCSKQCQIVDWREHKYYCVEMPELIIKSPPPSSSSSKFQSDNRKTIQSLRKGEHRAVWMPASSSENSSQAAESRRHSEPIRIALMRDDESEGSPQPVAFNFAGYPKYNDDVVLVHVRHANTFYIRTCCSDNKYKKNAKDFDDYGMKGKMLLSLPRKNDVVLVLHDGKFRRALVLNVESEDRIDVGLVDIGRKVRKNVYEMRQISEELRRRARYNFIVTLDHIPKHASQDQFKRLLKFLSKQTVFIVRFDGEDWQSSRNIKLLEKYSGFPIQKLVLQDEMKQFHGNDTRVDKNVKVVEMDGGLPMATLPLGHKPFSRTARGETASSSRIVKDPIHSPNAAKSHHSISFADLATETLPDVAELVIMDNTSVHKGFVIAVTTKNISKLDDLHYKVNYCGDAIHEVYDPGHEELCLVKFDGEWNRAISFETKFLLIDWGTLESIDRRDIRRFPEVLKDPCYTFVCNIEGVTDELDGDPEKIEPLKELLAIQSCHPHCVCVEVEGKPMEYNVKFPKLSNFFD